jgi:hypothetical protein
MKHIIKLALLAAFSFLSISGASAQAIARAEIPFDFSCQRQAMPRGEYTISMLQERFIQLSSKDGKTHAVSLFEPNVKIGGPSTKLVFHRYGDRYFLNEVQTANRELGMKLLTSKAERQTRLNETGFHRGDTAFIALR